MSMEDDVLEVFEDERAERQAAIDAAIRRLGDSHETPRVEQWQDRKGRDRFTLVRTDGDIARITDSTAKAVTTKFTPDEWAVIERTVLLRYGLALADLNEGAQQ